MFFDEGVDRVDRGYNVWLIGAARIISSKTLDGGDIDCG
jgi:hypothetical protein